MNGRKVVAHCLALLLLAAFAHVGCVRVPPEAVVLSSTVGQRIADLQVSHEAFVSAYFQLSRERVEDFLRQRWIPTFLGHFVEGAELMSQLESAQALSEEEKARLRKELQSVNITGDTQAAVFEAIHRALGGPKQGELVLQFSQAAMKQIEEKRKSLIDPLNELERRTLNELRNAYAQLEQAQNTVTAHLSSVRKVTAEQDKVLEHLNLLRKRDDIIEKAINTNERVMGILDAGKKAEDTLKDLESELGSLKNSS